MISICVKAGREQRLFYFEKPELAVGRAEENDLVLADERVSKRHCKILVLDGRFRLLDLKSTNGSFVNRVRVSEYTIIKINDEIRVGDHVLWITSELAQTHQNSYPRGGEPEASSGREPPVTQAPPTAQLRSLIEATLIADSELDAFCIDQFPEIKRRFTLSMDRTTKVNILLERAKPLRLYRLLHSEQNSAVSAPCSGPNTAPHFKDPPLDAAPPLNCRDCIAQRKSCKGCQP